MTAPDFFFTYHAAQRQRFRDGLLVREWRERYPILFDEKDEELARNQPQYHFFEWLSAALLYEATGYQCLVEGYTAKTHQDKRKVLEVIVGGELFCWLDTHQSGQPDLFAYCQGADDWFFCEVKGGPDRLRDNQKVWMEAFQEHTGKCVRVIQLDEYKQ